jgi:hypothetical protein
MERFRSPSRSQTRAIIPFLVGALAHYLMLKLYVHFLYNGGAGAAVVREARTSAAFAILGGIMLATFMSLLFSRLERTPGIQRSALILRAGIYGVLSTICALEVFFVLVSVWWSFVIKGGNQLAVSGRALLLFIEVQFYGISPITRSIPFAFIVGVLAEQLVTMIAKTDRVWAPENARSLARLSIACAVISFLSLGLLSMNLPFAIAGMSLGIFALRRWGENGICPKVVAATSVLLAMATITLSVVLRVMFFHRT